MINSKLKENIISENVKFPGEFGRSCRGLHWPFLIFLSLFLTQLLSALFETVKAV